MDVPVGRPTTPSAHWLDCETSSNRPRDIRHRLSSPDPRLRLPIEPAPAPVCRGISDANEHSLHRRGRPRPSLGCTTGHRVPHPLPKRLGHSAARRCPSVGCWHASLDKSASSSAVYGTATWRLLTGAGVVPTAPCGSAAVRCGEELRGRSTAKHPSHGNRGNETLDGVRVEDHLLVKRNALPHGPSPIWASTRRVRVALAHPSRGSRRGAGENKRPYGHPEVARRSPEGGRTKREAPSPHWHPNPGRVSYPWARQDLQQGLGRARGC